MWIFLILIRNLDDMRKDNFLLNFLFMLVMMMLPTVPQIKNSFSSRLS